jgi:hypothetical protein
MEEGGSPDAITRLYPVRRIPRTISRGYSLEDIHAAVLCSGKTQPDTASLTGIERETHLLQQTSQGIM